MTTLQSEKQELFTDLFYAAVIGFAVSRIESDNDIFYYLVVFCSLLFVIEDWYTYYKRVVGIIIGKNYNLYNIIIEFGILICWSISFSAALKCSLQFALWFGLFMFLKWWGGARYHYRRDTLLSREGIGEHLYALSAIASFCGYFFASAYKDSFHELFTFVFFSWLLIVISNWNLYRESQENHDSS